MAKFEVILEIGGLCMIVKSTVEEPGIHVLMPAMKHMGMMHCAMMMTHRESEAAAGKSAQLHPYDGHHDDLRRCAVAGPAGTPPGELLPISTYGGKRVDPAWLSTAPNMNKCLAAKVIVPLSASMTVVGDKARLRVEGHPAAIFAGRVLIRFEVDGTDIKIGGRTLPPVGNKVKIRLLNVPFEMLDEKKRKYVVDEELPHPQAYYHLLTGNCAPPRDGPRVFSGVEQPKEAGARPAANFCPANVQDYEKKNWDPRFVAEFVDPVGCIMAVGDA